MAMTLFFQLKGNWANFLFVLNCGSQILWESYSCSRSAEGFRRGQTAEGKGRMGPASTGPGITKAFQPFSALEQTIPSTSYLKNASCCHTTTTNTREPFLYRRAAKLQLSSLKREAWGGCQCFHYPFYSQEYSSIAAQSVLNSSKACSLHKRVNKLAFPSMPLAFALQRAVFHYSNCFVHQSMKSQTLNSAHELEKFRPDNFISIRHIHYSTPASPHKTNPSSGSPYPFLLAAIINQPANHSENKIPASKHLHVFATHQTSTSFSRQQYNTFLSNANFHPLTYPTQWLKSKGSCLIMPLMFSRFCSCHYQIVNDWSPWIPRNLFQLWLSDGHSTNPRNANRAVLSYVTMRSGPEFITYHPFNHISTQILPQNRFFSVYFVTLRNLLLQD